MAPSSAPMRAPIRPTSTNPVESGPSSVTTLAVMTLPTIQGGSVEEY
jgi:hypothetical protein